MSTQKTLETLVISLDQIYVNDRDNARKIYDETGLNALAASLKDSGMLNPITVRRVTDHDRAQGLNGYLFVLIAGYRRVRAARKLEWKDIRASVVEIEAPEDAAIINLTENIARRDLSTYEQAQAFVDIRDTYKLTGEEIAKRIKDVKDRGGLSKASINNYMRSIDKLPPEILLAWEENHEKTTCANLFKIASLPDHDAMLDAWDVLTGKGPVAGDEGGTVSDGDSDGAKPTDAGPTAKPLKRPTVDAILLQLSSLKHSEGSEDWKKGVKHALEFAAGKRTKIPGLKVQENEPEVEDADEKPRKKRDK